MDSNNVNRWLTLGANIGVLIGIILLVFELDQNRDAIRAQIRNDISQQLSGRLLIAASNEQFASVMHRAESGEELTGAEQRQYWLYVVANLRDWENIHYQYRQGTFDEVEFNAEKVAWRYVVNRSVPFADVWCRTRLNYSKAFAAELDSLLDEDLCAATQDE